MTRPWVNLLAGLLLTVGGLVAARFIPFPCTSSLSRDYNRLAGEARMGLQ